MGNCWRMPEDHSGLLHPTSGPFTSSSGLAAVTSSNISYSTFRNISSDTPIPKLVPYQAKPTDITAIKAAQCRNLVERLPLIAYNEKLIKRTDCAICLIDFQSNELVRQLPCDGGHVFHPCCIDQWLEKSLTCPHCSANVDATLLLQFVPHSKDDDDNDD